MKVKAAICWEPQKPLALDEIDLEGPRAGECLVRLAASGVCHTDAYTMSGRDPSGLFPTVLGHEGAGVVEEIGPGVSSLKVGDHVIPLYIPECRQCKFCLSGKTNLCSAILATQGQGLMPDGTSRLSYQGTMLRHYMGTSTFAEYTVVPEIALAKIRADAPLDKVCLLGCGITTGIGAVLNTAKVHPGATVAIYRARRHRRLGGAGRGDGRRGAHHRHRQEPGEVRVGAPARGDRVHQPRRGGEPRRGGGRDDRRRRRLRLRMHRQRRGHEPGADELPQGLGAVRSSSASPAPARRSTCARSCWSPGGPGAAPPSAARADGPSCPPTSTGHDPPHQDRRVHHPHHAARSTSTTRSS